MTILASLLALFNTLVAILVVAISLSANELRDAAPLWLFVKLVSALMVILIGGLTWLAGMRQINRGVMLLSSLFLVALGSASAVWTLHLAQVTGDMESYMIVYGGSLIVQGVASLWSQQPSSEHAAGSTP